MTARQAWSGVSAGVFLLGLAWLIQSGRPWYWVFLVLAATSLVGSLVKGHWRWSVQALLWGGGMYYAWTTEGVSAWAAFVALFGISLILGFLLGLVPRREDGRLPPPPPPPPGEGVVIDVEVRRP